MNPQERCEPGVCKVARYHGPLVLELRPDVPGVSAASAERFSPGPAAPAFAPAWTCRADGGDITLLAADGSAQRAHRLVLQCRLPALCGDMPPGDVSEVWPESAVYTKTMRRCCCCCCCCHCVSTPYHAHTSLLLIICTAAGAPAWCDRWSLPACSCSVPVPGRCGAARRQCTAAPCGAIQRADPPCGAV